MSTKPEELWYNEIKTFFKEEHTVVYAPQMAPHHNPEIQAMFDEVVDEAMTKVAKNMLENGIDEELIAKCTSLPIEKVRKLKST